MDNSNLVINVFPSLVQQRFKIHIVHVYFRLDCRCSLKQKNACTGYSNLHIYVIIFIASYYLYIFLQVYRFLGPVFRSVSTARFLCYNSTSVYFTGSVSAARFLCYNSTSVYFYRSTDFLAQCFALFPKLDFCVIIVPLYIFTGLPISWPSVLLCFHSWISVL